MKGLVMGLEGVLLPGWFVGPLETQHLELEAIQQQGAKTALIKMFSHRLFQSRQKHPIEYSASLG